MNAHQQHLGLTKVPDDTPRYQTAPAAELRRLMTPIQRIEAQYASLVRRRDAAKAEWERTGMDTNRDAVRNNRRAAYEHLKGAADAMHDALLIVKGEM